jgi:predicted DNA-binding transcriptional regulator AlpA
MDSSPPAAIPCRASTRSRRQPDYAPDDPLLTAAEAAVETGRGLSTFWRDVRAGRLPPAYYVTSRCPRWRRSELRAAVDACRVPATACRPRPGQQRRGCRPIEPSHPSGNS